MKKYFQPFLHNKRFNITFLGIALFILGLFVGIVGSKYFDPCNNKFTYINPALNCGARQVVNKSHPIALKERLSQYIESKKESNEVDRVSIYFRDLHDGPILGINEDELFISASLLKLPTALTVFKLTEVMPDIFSRRLRFREDIKQGDTFEQYFKPTKTVKPGSYYTVRQLIFNSLVYSDNVSNEVLKSSLKSIDSKKDLRLQTYHELGLISLKNNGEFDISTRSYATIFRILYNASYVSLENSEEILSMLSQSEFDQGISAGVPRDMKVANKFGERFIGEEKQLHDCGIIYYPDNPYILCVMTRGDNFEELKQVISDISKMVYEEIDLRKI